MRLLDYTLGLNESHIIRFYVNDYRTEAAQLPRGLITGKSEAQAWHEQRAETVLAVPVTYDPKGPVQGM